MGCVSRPQIFKGLFALGLLLATVAAVPAQAAEMRLLVLGDSLTAGYGLSAKDAFPAQLERALKAKGYDIKVINSGISGDTTKGGLQRLPWVLSSKPQFVIVELGSNDSLRGLDPRHTRANLDGIITRLKAKGIKVLLAGMLAPRNLGPDYAKEFNGAFRDLAKKHDVVFMPFFLKDVALRPHLNQRDGIHPTPEGVAIIVRNIMPYVVKLLGPARS
jgi:acyl-CoA thioesterase-1